MDAPLPDGYRVRLLEGGLAWALGRMTFPAYRGLLPSASPQGPVLAAALFAPAADPALDLGLPQGLALARRDGADAALLSVYVSPEARGKRRSARLVRAMEDALAAAGASRVAASLTLDTPGGAALAAVLEAGGWSPPERRMLSFRTDYATVAQAPWMREAGAPAGCRVVPWAQVAGDFRQRLGDAAAVPEDLLPARHAGRGAGGGAFEPRASFALLDAEALVGWVLVHRLSARTMRVTASYVLPRRQARLAVAALWRSAIAAGHAHGYRDAVWTVPVRHAAMLRFAERRMAPFCTEVRPIAGTSKVLPAAAPA